MNKSVVPMIQIGDTLISTDIVEKFFHCNLSACRGACCIQGDAGAPLEEEELKIIEENLEIIKTYLGKESIKVLKKEGFHTIDDEKDLVTTLLPNESCVFIVNDNGIAKCAIEKAYFDGKICFRKPLSCHLYPIRIKKYPLYDAVNYDINMVCNPAIIDGTMKNIRIFEFVKEALIRKYGENWYKQLEYASEHLNEI